MRKRRGFFARAFAATMAIWLGLVITEPLPIDSCPMHGSHAMHGVALASHAGHHAASHGGAPTKASNQCTCIGDCAASRMSFGAASENVAVLEAGITAFREAPPAAAVAGRVQLPAHTLPPANGPPTIS